MHGLFEKSWKNIKTCICSSLDMFIYYVVCLWDLNQTIQNIELALLLLLFFFFLHLKLSSRNWSEKHPLISAVQDQACFRNSTNIYNVSITGCPWERSAFLSLLGQYILASFQISFLLTNNRRDISQELIMEKKNPKLLSISLYSNVWHIMMMCSGVCSLWF